MAAPRRPQCRRRVTVGARSTRRRGTVCAEGHHGLLALRLGEGLREDALLVNRSGPARPSAASLTAHRFLGIGGKPHLPSPAAAASISVGPQEPDRPVVLLGLVRVQVLDERLGHVLTQCASAYGVDDRNGVRDEHARWRVDRLVREPRVLRP